MQINTDFWGQESEWLTPSNTTLQSAGVKTINFNTASLPDYWSSGYKATGERSYSIYDPPKPEQTPTAWGIGKLSALSNPLYAFAGYSNTATGSPYSDANVTPYTRDMRVDKNIPLSMCPQCYNYGVSDYVGWTRRVYPNLPNVNAINSQNCVCGGVTKFNYQNIVVYPMLKVCKKVPHSSSYKYGIQERSGYVSISDYFDGDSPVKNEYPYIMAVMINQWYMGEQPVYNNGVYVSGQRDSYGGNNFSLRFNEVIKGAEYNIQTSMRYNGVDNQTRSPQIQKDFYTLYPVSLYDSCLSGYYYNRIGYLSTMVNATIADDIEKAWTLSNDGNYPVITQNGHYDIEAIQEYDGTNYTNRYIVVSLWENATKDDVLRDVAFLGFWFSEDQTTARRALTGENCVDDKMHIPVFDSKGVTTGEWKSGSDAALESNAKWGDPFNDSPYNPRGGSDDDDFGDLDNSIYRGINFYNLKMYALTETMLQSFLAAVNAMYTGDGDTTQMELDFKGSNPNDYIVGLYGYPFDIPYNARPTNILLGPVDTGVSACITESQAWGALAFDSVYINPYYNDFRDYEPYTTIDLYLPLCGTVRLDPALYIGHYLNVEYDFDPMTGSLSAKIMRDNMIDKIVEGSIAVQIPVTAANMGDYQRSIHQIKSRIMQSAFSTVQALSPSSSFKSAAASQNTQGMVANIPDPFKIGMDVVSDIYNIGYDLKHTQPHVSVTGSSDPLNAMNMDNHIFVFIKRAKMVQGYDAQLYSQTVGNACCINALVGDMSGLIVSNNIDTTGIPATADEIKAIKQAFANGVII